MNQMLMDLLLTVISIVVTTLVTWATTRLIAFLNQKISDKKMARFSTTLAELVSNCVLEVSQTYVDTLKKEGKFDAEAQKKALDMCLNNIQTKLTPEIVDYIKSNFGDVVAYLKMLVEAYIKCSK